MNTQDEAWKELLEMVIRRLSATGILLTGFVAPIVGMFSFDSSSMNPTFPIFCGLLSFFTVLKMESAQVDFKNYDQEMSQFSRATIDGRQEIRPTMHFLNRCLLPILLVWSFAQSMWMCVALQIVGYVILYITLIIYDIQESLNPPNVP